MTRAVSSADAEKPSKEEGARGALESRWGRISRAEGGWLNDARTVTMRVRGGFVDDVSVTSAGAPHAYRALTGRPTRETLLLVPLLFHVAGTAHQRAALAACEEATGRRSSEAQQHARAILGQAETLAHHAARALVAWPLFLSETPRMEDLAPLRALLGYLVPQLFPNGDWARVGGARLRPRFADLSRTLDEVALRVRGCLLGPDEQTPRTLSALAAWARRGRTPGARLVGRVLAEDRAALGRTDVPLLPPLAPAAVGAQISANPAFEEAPTHRGRPAETGPLARQQAASLVEEVCARHGRGVLARLSADLWEQWTLPAALRDACRALAARGAGPEDAAPEKITESGRGTGVVEAPRGQLAHEIHVEAGHVAGWTVVSPEEWNFHANGVLRQALVGRRARDAAADARLLLLSIGADVPCQVVVEEAHHA